MVFGGFSGLGGGWLELSPCHTHTESIHVHMVVNHLRVLQLATFLCAAVRLEMSRSLLEHFNGHAGQHGSGWFRSFGFAECCWEDKRLVVLVVVRAVVVQVLLNA